MTISIEREGAESCRSGGLDHGEVLEGGDV